MMYERKKLVKSLRQCELQQAVEEREKPTPFN